MKAKVPLKEKGDVHAAEGMTAPAQAYPPLAGVGRDFVKTK